MSTAATQLPQLCTRRRYRVLHCISGLQVGGTGQLLLRNLQHLSQNQFESFVCYLVPRHDLRPAFQEAGFSPICMDHRCRWHAPRTVFRLARLIRDLHIQLVHTNIALDRIYAGLAAAVTRVPTVTTLISARPPETNAKRGRFNLTVWIRSGLEELMGRLLCHRFVAVSQATRDIHVRHHGLPAHKVSVVYSGLAVDAFGTPTSPATLTRLRSELGLENAWPILLNVGRLNREKGQRHLLGMMTHLLERWPRAHLLIAGEGEERPLLEREITQGGLERHVRLLGQRMDIPDLLALADVFVFPSISEALGYGVLEAMAAGRPVVASNVGGIPEAVIDGVTGLLVEPAKPRALAQSVARMLEFPELAQALAHNGQRLVQQTFDVRASVRSLERVYLSVLSATTEQVSTR